jgi:hypothetical protein
MKLGHLILGIIFINFFSFGLIAQTVKETCPTITISGSNRVMQPGENELFSVLVASEKSYHLEYSWAVSNGRIVSGQGTSTVAVKRLDCEAITATVEIEGLPVSCPRTFSESSMIANGCGGIERVKMDQYGRIPSGEEKARLDAFLVELSNDSIYVGVIVLDDSNYLKNRLAFIRSYLKARKFDLAKIYFAISEDIGDTTILWKTSRFNPEEPCEKCLIFKAEDYEKLEKLFTPKPKTKRRNK